MNPLVVITILCSISALTNGQTPTITANCPTGEYFNYVSTAYLNQLSPVTTLAGTRYTSGGFYAVTASNGADQCCYNCRTQTNGACTTWTYDNCGRCYLSSATGSSNYLQATTTSSRNTCGAGCTAVASGFIPSTLSTRQSNCTILVDQNVPTGSTFANQDRYTTATDASACCNQCGTTTGCLGFAFLPSSNCWLKFYDPFGASAPSAPVSYAGMIVGALQTTASG